MGILRSIVGAESRASKLAGAHPSSDAAASLFGLNTTASGVTVDDDTAMNIAAVWACVRAISDDVSNMPVGLVRRSPGRRDAIDGHPAHRLLNTSPNPEMTPKNFRETITAYAILRGNGYAEIVRNGAGAPVEVWPIPSSWVVPKRNPAGRLEYEVHDQSGRPKVLDADHMLHIAGLGWNGICGMSVVRYAREAMGGAIAAERYGGRWFANGSRPSVVLKHPKSLSSSAHATLKQSWQEMQAGMENAGRAAILEEGMDIATVSMSPEDSQFLETRKFQVSEIARWFRIPPHIIGDLERATFNNIEQLGLQYLMQCLMGWIVRWEQEIRIKLIREPDVIAKHNPAAILRGDIKTRYEAYATARQWGWMSADDVLELEDRNPLPDEQGSLYMFPVNMTTAERVASGELPGNPNNPPAPPPAPNPGGGDDMDRAAHALVSLASSAVAGLLRVEADKHERAAKRGDVAGWIESWYPSHQDHVRGVWFPLVECAWALSAAPVKGGPAPIPEQLRTWLDGVAERHVKRSIEAIRSDAKLEPEKAEEIAERELLALAIVIRTLIREQSNAA